MGRLPPCAGLAATRARFARTCDIADIVCLGRIAFALRLALAHALLFTHLLGLPAEERSVHEVLFSCRRFKQTGARRFAAHTTHLAAHSCHTPAGAPHAHP